VKPIVWCGDSLRKIRSFPEAARGEGGHQLNRMQQGLDPHDWKPMTTVGIGVRELRIHQDGEFRVLYVAKFPEAIYVLSAFEKKSRQTPQNEVRLAADRLRSVIEARRRQRR
jgi:phage-related protein